MANVRGLLNIGIVVETDEVVVQGILSEKKLCLAALRKAFKIVRNFKPTVIERPKIIVPGH